MFDAQCDLAALVYGPHQDPDAVLSDFAGDLNARGFRVVGMVQAGQCADSSLSAVLLHSGEKLLLARIPPHPAPSSKRAGKYPHFNNLPIDLTQRAV